MFRPICAFFCIACFQGVGQVSLDKYRNDEALPEITREILSELVIRKKQAVRLKKKRNTAGYLTIVSGILLACGFFILNGQAPASFHQFSLLLRRPEVWFIAGILMILIISYLKKQRDTTDAEDDFDELREQVIDRTSELWPKEPDGHTRTEVMRALLSEYDINLFYK